MKRLILISLLCILCVGCGTNQKYTSTNIYNDKDNKELVDKKKDSKDIVYNTETINNEKVETETKTLSSNNTSENVVETKPNSVKAWYNENKDELKSITSDIKEDDKNTINSLIDSAKTWYTNNSEEIKSSSKEIHESDKGILLNIYNKIKK